MTPRAPDGLEPLATAIGTTPDQIESRLLDLGGRPPGLGDQGADPNKLPEALDAMLLRPELAFTPDPPSRDELKHLIDNAW